MGEGWGEGLLLPPNVKQTLALSPSHEYMGKRTRAEPHTIKGDTLEECKLRQIPFRLDGSRSAPLGYEAAL